MKEGLADLILKEGEEREEIGQTRVSDGFSEV
jgi:hypothetical protein